MKKSARFARRAHGFTLVELLIVISIIAILAVIGFAVLGNFGGKARDARKKADIDQMAKAYEVNYNQGTGAYTTLTAGQFTSGVIPTPPEGGTATYTCVAGPSTGCTTSSTSTFTVCATLDGGTAGCSATSSTCYCRLAAQSSSAAQAGVPACAKFNNMTSQSCEGYDSVTGILTVPIFIKCSEIPAAITNIVCSNATCAPAASGGVPAMPYYTSATATTAAGNLSDLRTSGCPAAEVTVTIRN